MALDPRHVSLQLGAARAAQTQARLSATWRPLDPPTARPSCASPTLDAMGLPANLRGGAREDPTARWMGAPGMQATAPRPAAPETLRFTPTPDERPTVTQDLVDVYLSAGPAENLELSEPVDFRQYRSCNFEDESNCSLYRVRVNLVTGIAAEVELVVPSLDNQGAVQPALSPSGQRLAYVYRSSTESEPAFLVAVDLPSGRAHIPAYGSSPGGSVAGHNRPQFPNWFDEGVLLYHVGPKEHSTLYSTSTASGSTYGFEDPVAILGPRSSTHTDISFADAATWRGAPSIGGAAAPGSSMSADVAIATFGPYSDAITMPRVHGLHGGKIREFVPGSTVSGLPALGCHHPAWSPDGTKVMCNMQDPSDSVPSGIQNPESKLLYAYQRSGATWTNTGLAFQPISPQLLEDSFGDLFPQSAPAGQPWCQVYTYKYSQWCVNENFIVATLFCSDVNYNENKSIFSSRVMLIKSEGNGIGSSKYIDLTRAVERALGVSAGQFHGIYATCVGNR